METNVTSDFTLHFPQQFVDCFANGQCCMDEELKMASSHTVVQHPLIIFSMHFKMKIAMFT